MRRSALKKMGVWGLLFFAVACNPPEKRERVISQETVRPQNKTYNDTVYIKYYSPGKRKKKRRITKINLYQNVALATKFWRNWFKCALEMEYSKKIGRISSQEAKLFLKKIITVNAIYEFMNRPAPLMDVFMATILNNNIDCSQGKEGASDLYIEQSRWNQIFKPINVRLFLYEDEIPPLLDFDAVYWVVTNLIPPASTELLYGITMRQLYQAHFSYYARALYLAYLHDGICDGTVLFTKFIQKRERDGTLPLIIATLEEVLKTYDPEFVKRMKKMKSFRDSVPAEIKKLARKIHLHKNKFLAIRFWSKLQLTDFLNNDHDYVSTVSLGNIYKKLESLVYPYGDSPSISGSIREKVSKLLFKLSKKRAKVGKIGQVLPGVKFMRINPSGIKWMAENLIPRPQDIINGTTAQVIYNKHYRRHVRTYYRIFLYLKLYNANASEIKYYYRKDAPGAGCVFYTPLNHLVADIYGKLLPSDIGTYDLPKVLFWIRRILDGSSDMIGAALYAVLKEYDRDFLQYLPLDIQINTRKIGFED